MLANSNKVAALAMLPNSKKKAMHAMLVKVKEQAMHAKLVKTCCWQKPKRRPRELCHDEEFSYAM